MDKRAQVFLNQAELNMVLHGLRCANDVIRDEPDYEDGERAGMIAERNTLYQYIAEQGNKQLH